jgi:hypothetical protein
MKTELRQGEQVIRKGSANLQKNVETVGGKLYLTNERLIFEAHRFNVQRGVTEVELSNIDALSPSWTRQWGLLPIFPNSLAIHTKLGEEYRFVLFGRSAWAAAIESQRKAYGHS